MHLSKTSSNLLKQPSDSVAEVASDLFTRILRDHFSIYSEVIPGKRMGVRYFNTSPTFSNADTLSMAVYPHSGGTRIGPLIIFSVLRKFDISVEAYAEAVLAGPKPMPKAVNQ
jgi:hypothetical protein